MTDHANIRRCPHAVPEKGDRLVSACLINTATHACAATVDHSRANSQTDNSDTNRTVDSESSPPLYVRHPCAWKTQLNELLHRAQASPEIGPDCSAEEDDLM
ncbi:hypothetical protein SKAU_G00256970 [Synaphobranchus kaupii]|uniref:Uncharacterized protein n=1 Tax=Synaphobranchus kaupii TaxID=118154 RepID=A0A9Q1F4C3_SYNKA|nr:hypothetical protein SKAU_G00256970 [Synaphobranchus kaupii]